MPSFIRFNDADGTTINLKYLSSIACDSRKASQSDVERNPAFQSEGQVIYSIRFTVIGDSKASMEFVDKQFRDSCYNEIIALIRPTIIGANPPASSLAPESSTPSDTAKQPPVNPVLPVEPPTPKPPRKPRTPRQ
jgi:hypothetical protein